MMNGLVFATHNLHKVQEVSAILGKDFRIISLKDLGCETDIPETSDTLQGNALQKARFVYDCYKEDCFADDTGLEVEVLNGAPGVYTARYAGPACRFEDNIDKLLCELKEAKNRKARFRTVIALIMGGKEYLFEGRIDGTITKERCGTKGFGYDPVFCPDGYEESFAEMGPDEKNKISHRAVAMRKLANFLKK